MILEDNVRRIVVAMGKIPYSSRGGIGDVDRLLPVIDLSIFSDQPREVVVVVGVVARNGPVTFGAVRIARKTAKNVVDRRASQLRSIVCDLIHFISRDGHHLGSFLN